MKIAKLTSLSSAVCGIAMLSACGSSIPSNPKEGELVEVEAGDVTFELVYVAPGSFSMGATPENEGVDTFSELPVHKVKLTKGYFIGKNEVTQAQWTAIMGSNPSSQKEFNGKEDSALPVTDITWADAQQFVKKLSEVSGHKFRLPTEAEWEYAARGASKTYSHQYSGSLYLDQVGCFSKTSNGVAHPVGQFRPNEIGTYDMSGNVAEWVADNYEKYKDSAQVDPCVTISDTLAHVVRGGCFAYKMSQCRTASRENYMPADKSALIGLRIVMEKE